MMLRWIKENWDKLLGTVIPVILAGIIGYYSGILSLQKEINDLKIETALLKSKIEEAVIPQLKTLESHSDKINALEINMTEIKTTTQFIISRTNDLNNLTSGFLQNQSQFQRNNKILSK